MVFSSEYTHLWFLLNDDSGINTNCVSYLIFTNDLSFEENTIQYVYSLLSFKIFDITFWGKKKKTKNKYSTTREYARKTIYFQNCIEKYKNVK